MNLTPLARRPHHGPPRPKGPAMDPPLKTRPGPRFKPVDLTQPSDEVEQGPVKPHVYARAGSTDQGERTSSLPPHAVPICPKDRPSSLFLPDNLPGCFPAQSLPPQHTSHRKKSAGARGCLITVDMELFQPIHRILFTGSEDDEAVCVFVSGFL
jgi:hypothetical protein